MGETREIVSWNLGQLFEIVETVVLVGRCTIFPDPTELDSICLGYKIYGANYSHEVISIIYERSNTIEVSDYNRN